jgi:poly(3-hydroxybutyrate) depolymerase
MASVMLATYPEVFAGGAITAGRPYGCANNVQQAFEAMFAPTDLPQRRLVIACGPHLNIADPGRQSLFGMAPAIRS